MSEVEIVAVELSSPAFEDGKQIPQEYSGEGANVSPPLKWSELPRATRSLALICEDPDAPGGTFTHWIIFNIIPHKRELEEGIPHSGQLDDSSRQGRNSAGSIGYMGPYPPEGSTHRYFFKLYALDTMLDLQPGVSRSEIMDAMNGHFLAEAQLMGIYRR